MKRIYIIRHCEAEGQHPEAPLTEKGIKQANNLSEFFSKIEVDRIISSPFKRAIESIEPLAKKLNIEVEIEENLKERVLSTLNLSAWFEKLKETFDDLELKLEGGESSKGAMNRIVQVAERAFNYNNTIIVTHGNIMSLLLKHYNQEFGFEDWKKLSNPDVFLLKNEGNKITFERIWE